MKKLLIPVMIVVLVTVFSVPMASADMKRGRGNHGNQVTRNLSRGGGGCVGCALVGGLVLGGILGGLIVATHDARPTLVPPPRSSCFTQRGYWTRVAYKNSPWRTTYRNVWVPPHTICR